MRNIRTRRPKSISFSARMTLRPARRLLVRRDRVFEVDADRVGGAGRGLLDHRRLRRRHEQLAAGEARQNDLGIPSTCSPMYDRIRFVEIGAT